MTSPKEKVGLERRSRRAHPVIRCEGPGSDGETGPVNFAFSRPPLGTEEGGVTKSQIGQAFGNDVLEWSRPCRVAHVQSLKWQWIQLFSVFFDGAIETFKIDESRQDSRQTQQLRHTYRPKLLIPRRATKIAGNKMAPFVSPHWQVLIACLPSKETVEITTKPMHRRNVSLPFTIDPEHIARRPGFWSNRAKMSRHTSQPSWSIFHETQSMPMPTQLICT